MAELLDLQKAFDFNPHSTSQDSVDFDKFFPPSDNPNKPSLFDDADLSGLSLGEETPVAAATSGPAREPGRKVDGLEV